MSETPFMPKATAVWLVENTTLTFKQIANFCNLHELEIKGIADGDVAKGIKAYNPILAGQLSREVIDECSNDPNKFLSLSKKTEDVQQNLITSSNIYPITYKVRKDKNGNWLIINIIVNGVNLGLTFRNQFQALAKEHNENINEIIKHWTSDANLD